MQCPMDFSGHESGKQPHNERHLTTVNTKKWPNMQAYFYQLKLIGGFHICSEGQQEPVGQQTR